MYLTQFCYACKYVSKCLHVGLPTCWKTARNCASITKAWWLMSYLRRRTPPAPFLPWVLHVATLMWYCVGIVFKQMETLLLEDRMSPSNTARQSLWASVLCRRMVWGREGERVGITKGGNEAKEDNKRDHK